MPSGVWSVISGFRLEPRSPFQLGRCLTFGPARFDKSPTGRTVHVHLVEFETFGRSLANSRLNSIAYAENLMRDDRPPSTLSS